MSENKEIEFKCPLCQNYDLEKVTIPQQFITPIKTLDIDFQNIDYKRGYLEGPIILFRCANCHNIISTNRDNPRHCPVDNEETLIWWILNVQLEQI